MNNKNILHRLVTGHLMAVIFLNGWVGCAAAAAQNKSRSGGQNRAATSVNALAKKDLQNFVYLVPRLSNGYEICRLRNGLYQEPGGASVSFDSATFGDLNKDGKTDAAAAISYYGGGTGAFASLLLFLNDGKALKQIDNIDYPLGDRDIVSGIAIRDGKILINKMERQGNQSMADAPLIRKKIVLQLRRLPELELASEDFASNEPGGGLEPCAKLDHYLSQLSDSIAAQWAIEKKQAADEYNIYKDHLGKQKPKIAFPAGIKNPVVIRSSCNPKAARQHVANMALIQSSGNDYWDNMASGTLTTVSDLDSVPETVAESPTSFPLECTFAGDKVTLKQLQQSRQALAEGRATVTAASPQSPPQDLTAKAKDFAFALLSDNDTYCFYPLQGGRYKDVKRTIECINTATGDLNADGQPDVAVLLEMKTAAEAGKEETVHILSALLNTGTGLSQAGQSSYVFENGGLPLKAADCNILSAVKVKSLAIQNGRVVAHWQGQKADEPADKERITQLFVALPAHLDSSETAAGKQIHYATVGTLIAQLSKSLGAAWSEAIETAKDSRQGGEKDAQKATSPLAVRIVFNTIANQTYATQPLSWSGSKTFDQAAMNALLSSKLSSHLDEQSPTNNFLELDVTFSPDGKHLNIKESPPH